MVVSSSVGGFSRRAIHYLSSAEVRVALPILNLCVALWLLGLLNIPFWEALWRAVDGWHAERALFLLSLPVFVLLWVWLTLELCTWGRLAKPALALLLIVSASVAYFMRSYKIVFDSTMIENILGTDKSESIELLSWRMLISLLAFALPSIWLLGRVRINPRSWRQQLLDKAITIAVLLCGIVVLVAPFVQSYAPLLRNHPELRVSLVPSNYLAALHYHIRAQFMQSEHFEHVAMDAHRSAVPGAKPTLAILVIGETARAANFGVNGYVRDTTPQLAVEPGIISLRQVRSCGTSTAVSLPCMFLDVGRSGFTQTMASHRENLLDVLLRAGYAVLWRDNNSGCKGICDRVTQQALAGTDAPELCKGGECFDEILLQGLQQAIDGLGGDAVIVLHMKGSHGPAYYLRYPEAFEHFTPVCSTNQLDRCTQKSIVNAYDNTLRYTDHVLAQTIALLKRNSTRFDTFFLYVSDHGESLGERGLYLHGVPYSLAPTEQTHVPMLLWFGRDAELRFGINTACLRRRQDEPLSHDNLYHSVLGLLGVHTRIYRPERDLFRPCRTTSD